MSVYQGLLRGGNNDDNDMCFLGETFLSIWVEVAESPLLHDNLSLVREELIKEGLD